MRENMGRRSKGKKLDQYKEIDSPDGKESGKRSQGNDNCPCSSN
jgi:hypothetical protein